MNENDDELCDDEQWAMLCKAIANAEQLVNELTRKQNDLAAHPPDLPPIRLEQGRHAMDQAVASAQRMRSHLQRAKEMAAEGRGEHRTDLNREVANDDDHV